MIQRQIENQRISDLIACKEIDRVCSERVPHLNLKVDVVMRNKNKKGQVSNRVSKLENRLVLE